LSRMRGNSHVRFLEGKAPVRGLTYSTYKTVQDFRIGIPGMCLQVLGGYLFIKYLICK